VDHRSDLYSTGVILFEGVTGQQPFPAQTLYELLKAHVEQMPPAPSLLRPDVPRELENVLLHALQKDPNYRYQTAADFRAALEHAIAALGPEAFAPLAQPGAQVAVAATGVPRTSPPPAGYAAPMSVTPISPYTPVPTPYRVPPVPTPYPLPGYGAPMMHVRRPDPSTKSLAWIWIVVGAVFLVGLAFLLMTCSACAASC
jgi:serine/threonine-protein kinase